MDTFLIILLCLIFIFVIYMHNDAAAFTKLTKFLNIKTSMLRPEVSICELIILGLLLMIVYKLYL